MTMGVVAIDQPVKVYRNLRKNTFSVLSTTAPDRGRLIGHADVVVLANVTFKVSQAGRQRVLKDKQKNVHAYVVGLLQYTAQDLDLLDSLEGFVQEVTYNPYKHTTFVYKDTGLPCFSAGVALLINNRVYTHNLLGSPT